MSERERATAAAAPEASSEDEPTVQLPALYAAAYRPLQPSEALRQRVAEIVARQDAEAAPRLAWWQLQPIGQGSAAGVAAAALLLAVLGLILVRMEHGRSPGQHPLSTAKVPRRERGAPQPIPQLPLNNRERRIVTRDLVLPRRRDEDRPPFPFPVNHGLRSGIEGNRPRRAYPNPRPQSPSVDDLVSVNRDPEGAIQQWVPLRQDDWDKIEARVRRDVQVRDDFITIPFPRLASTAERQIAQAAESYKREAAIVDPRLSHEVTCAFKATALSDLCAQLRTETGIELTAGPSVADEKVTVFCERLPLREVMRQLSRPFGYTWLRSKRERGEYRYELVQDLKSQLLEEELRNRDRNAALIALDREIDRYRPYLSLSPDEALARLKNAPPEEKKLLEQIANNLGGWGPLQMYYRLSPQEQAELRSGQRLVYSQDPHHAGERPLPPDLVRGIFQTWRSVRLVKKEDGFSNTDQTDPTGRPLSAVPEARAWLFLGLEQSELGQFTLSGASGYFTPLTASMPRQAASLDGSGPLAVGISPAAVQPDNAILNARFARDPELRRRVTVVPLSCRQSTHTDEDRSMGPQSKIQNPKSKIEKVTSADVLEALHRATGLPIVADYYTRLYPPGAVSVQNQPLFEALNHLADSMRLRWNRDEGWLQFRSVTFYDDRRKDIPNRLLARWQASRRQNGMLTLEDLVEIAQLPEEQLQAREMAEGAELIWGLTEWKLFRNPVRHPYWRYLAEFTPAQRQKAMSATGLPFTEMSLAQQQRFIAVGLEWESHPLQSLDELAGAALRVDYTVPGWFEWRAPGPDWLRWVVPTEPGREGRRTLMPPVRARTREAALAAARRLFPSIRALLSQAVQHADATIDEAQLLPKESQIVPTELDLYLVHVPGSANRRHLHLVSAMHGMGSEDTW